jgi:molybdopterin molybdotransferase
MISYADALRIVLENVKPMRAVPMDPRRALGLVLTRPVRAGLRMPRHDQSAMDGIAVRLEDVTAASHAAPARLRVDGTLPAGTLGRMRLRAGGVVKVFTGGPLPRGTDAVVKVEDCEFEAGGVAVRSSAAAGQHIRRAGEEFERGQELLPAGARLTPPAIGLLSLFGARRVWVRSRPRVAVITMGDELARAGDRLGPTQIYDANGPALEAALRCLGVEQIKIRQVGDDPRDLLRALRVALRSSNLVLTVGGASVGDHDHAAAVRTELGVRELFDRVAVKPGKPNLFGIWRGRTPIFSLPGNPVSALVSFHQLVRPALRAMLGVREGDGSELRARLHRGVRGVQNRLTWLRASLEWDGNSWSATPRRAQGSHMLSGLAGADALLEVPAGAGLEAGSTVLARRLRWFD